MEYMFNLMVHGLDWHNVADLIMRLGVGIPFFISGMNKLFCPVCHGYLRSNLARSGIPCVGFSVWWVAFWEALAGFTLAVGFLTGASAFVLLIVCLVATKVSWRRKLAKKNPVHFWDACTEVGFMFDVLLIWLLLGIGFSGTGQFSVDYLIGW